MIKIPKLTVASGKAEEIKVIEDLHHHFEGTQTYLEHFFSGDLLRWFRAQVRDDFPADIMESLNSAYDECNKAEKARLNLQTRLDDLTKINEQMIRRHKEELEQKRRVIEQQQETIDKLDQTLATARKNASQVAQTNAELAREIEDRAAEILRLKARLFDLTEEKK